MQFSFSTNNNFMRPVGQMPSNAKKLSPKVGALITLALCLIFMAIGVFSMIRGDQTKNWPTVSGQVSSSHLSATSVSNNNNDSISYDVTAKYTVNGKTYTTGYTKSTSPVLGEEVKIKYDPNNPADAQIGDAAFMSWIFFAIGAVLAIVSVVMLVKARSSKQTDLGMDKR
jgi:hypothetical protein